MSAAKKLKNHNALHDITEDMILSLKDDMSGVKTPTADDEIMTHAEVQSKQEKAGEHMRRASSIYFRTQMPCWFSMQINLTEILLQEELFVISSHLSVFFKDNQHNDFKNLFDKNCQKLMEQNGNVRFDELNIEVRKKIPFKGSFILNSADIDIKRCHLEVYNKEKNVWQLYINFNASCAENMELVDFPFDAQFLNIQLVYSKADYYFESSCPDWILDDPDEKYKLFDLDKAIKLTVKDSIATQYKVERPWIDFRSRHNFGMIRLRVRRQPSFYLFNGVFPLFLVICCSFAAFVMPIELYLGDKLAYIITLLLTTAAYQYALNSELPKTPESTMIDTYVLYAYSILTFFVIEISVAQMMINVGYDEFVDIVDYISAGVAACVWIYKSGQFARGYYVFKTQDVNWDKLSEEDEISWGGGSKFMLVDDGRHKGTRVRFIDTV
eukprot:610427_1